MAQITPVLFIPDLHRPFHDTRAWDLVLKVGKYLHPEHIVIIGDFVDMFLVSSHSKDPDRKKDLQWEIDDGNQGLDELDALGASSKVYIAGNHEHRLKRYLRDKAPELFGTISIPTLLNLKDRGWKYVEYGDDARIGKLNLTHDVGVAGRNSTFKAIDKYQHSVITGHSHRLQYVVEGNAVGEYKLAAQFGWLGDRSQIDYIHRVNVNTNWALGFGYGYIHKNTGIAYVTPVPIVKYSCVVNGKYFEA